MGREFLLLVTPRFGGTCQCYIGPFKLYGFKWDTMLPREHAFQLRMQ